MKEVEGQASMHMVTKHTVQKAATTTDTNPAVLQVAEHGDLRLLKLRDPWGKHQDDGPWMHKFTEWSSELVDKIGHNFKDPGVSLRIAVLPHMLIQG